MGDLVRRLRGEYRIPITDGLGPAGGEEPENAREFVRKFETPPIQHEAAARIAALELDLRQMTDQWDSLQDYIAALEATNAELTAWNTGQSDRILALEAELASGSFYQEKDIDAMQDRIAALDAEVARLRDACNTARLAFAGYVSADAAIRKLDALEAGQ